MIIYRRCFKLNISRINGLMMREIIVIVSGLVQKFS